MARRARRQRRSAGAPALRVKSKPSQSNDWQPNACQSKPCTGGPPVPGAGLAGVTSPGAALAAGAPDRWREATRAEPFAARFNEGYEDTPLDFAPLQVADRDILVVGHPSSPVPGFNPVGRIGYHVAQPI